MTLINLSIKESPLMPSFYHEFALPKWIKLGINTVRNIAEGRVGLRKFARELCEAPIPNRDRTLVPQRRINEDG